MSERPQVLIVGAGFSGIGVAAGLRKAGFDDFLLVDDGDGFGGTWNWNRYPGVAVDIPSFSYQFSFAKQTSWSRVYAPGEELRDYADHCADRFDLRPNTRFHTHMSEATFDEDEHTWHLKTSDGEPIEARYVVDASGVLTVPKLPDIEGVETFGGATVHTSRWNADVPLQGKRVAIIGTGASAVQIIPAIAADVEHLTVFQRTPIWCLPKLDVPMPGSVRWILERVPGGTSALRAVSQTFVEVAFPLAAHYHAKLPVAGMFENSARSYLRQQVRDPEVRDKLTPRYALGCKRPSFHNEYLATFNRDDVTLETDPIARITETGIVTESGTEHEIDVLILATGFKVFESGNVPKYPITGRAGLDLEGWWTENRFQAYEGVSVPGFPNYFFMSGPYAYNGSSFFNLIETQRRHIIRLLEHARRRDATLIEVRAEANERYFDEMLRRRGNQVFWQDSCALANSYYFDPNGDVPLRPVSTLETIWRSRRFPLEDYRLESLVAADDPVAAAV